MSDLPELPEYKKEHDIYWRVRRDFCSVSNRTYGPIGDWQEDDIKAAVDILRVSIHEMLIYHVDKASKNE